jgi:hypothetical protein
VPPWSLTSISTKKHGLGPGVGASFLGISYSSSYSTVQLFIDFKHILSEGSRNMLSPCQKPTLDMPPKRGKSMLHRIEAHIRNGAIQGMS